MNFTSAMKRRMEQNHALRFLDQLRREYRMVGSPGRGEEIVRKWEEFYSQWQVRAKKEPALEEWVEGLREDFLAEMEIQKKKQEEIETLNAVSSRAPDLPGYQELLESLTENEKKFLFHIMEKMTILGGARKAMGRLQGMLERKINPQDKITNPGPDIKDELKYALVRAFGLDDKSSGTMEESILRVLSHDLKVEATRDAILESIFQEIKKDKFHNSGDHSGEIQYREEVRQIHTTMEILSQMETKKNIRHGDIYRNAVGRTFSGLKSPRGVATVSAGIFLSQGFSSYVALASAVGALSGALGVTLPFAFYTSLTSAVSVVLPAMGAIMVAGAAGFAIYKTMKDRTKYRLLLWSALESLRELIALEKELQREKERYLLQKEKCREGAQARDQYRLRLKEFREAMNNSFWNKVWYALKKKWKSFFAPRTRPHFWFILALCGERPVYCNPSEKDELLYGIDKGLNSIRTLRWDMSRMDGRNA